MFVSNTNLHRSHITTREIFQWIFIRNRRNYFSYHVEPTTVNGIVLLNKQLTSPTFIFCTNVWSKRFDFRQFTTLSVSFRFEGFKAVFLVFLFFYYEIQLSVRHHVFCTAPCFVYCSIMFWLKNYTVNQHLQNQ